MTFRSFLAARKKQLTSHQPTQSSVHELLMTRCVGEYAKHTVDVSSNDWFIDMFIFYHALLIIDVEGPCHHFLKGRRFNSGSLPCTKVRFSKRMVWETPLLLAVGKRGMETSTRVKITVTIKSAKKNEQGDPP